MKIRTDFVTNSSSSSFLVAYNSESKAVEVLLKSLHETIDRMDTDDRNDEYEMERVYKSFADAVYSLVSSKKLTEEEALSAYLEAWKSNEFYAAKYELRTKLEKAFLSAKKNGFIPDILKEAITEGFDFDKGNLNNLYVWVQHTPEGKAFLTRKAEVVCESFEKDFRKRIAGKKYIKIVEVEDYAPGCDIWVNATGLKVFDNH